MIGNILMVSEQGLEGNHHIIAEIAITGVVLHIIGKDLTGVDNTRYMIHIGIF